MPSRPATGPWQRPPSARCSGDESMAAFRASPKAPFVSVSRHGRPLQQAVHARIPQGVPADGKRRQGTSLEKYGLCGYAKMGADVLAGQNDGPPRLGRSPDPVEDTACHELVELRKGIVEQPDAWAGQEEAGQGHG